MKSKWEEEFRNLMRAVGGGLIFGTPLLFTMEMWQNGSTFHPAHLLAFLLLILLVNFVACLFLGLREKFTLPEAAAEAVESVAIGLVVSAGILAVIGEIDLAHFSIESLGKVIFQATAMSVGISITSEKFRSEEKDKEAIEEEEAAAKDPAEAQLRDDLRDLGGTVLGALLFAFNVAPTEEVTLIASRLSPAQQLSLLVATFFICHIILFASGFWKRPVFLKQSIFQKPWAETSMTMATSLVISSALVLLVGNGDVTSHASVFIANVLTLALPATVGGAAGRLAI